MHNGFVCMQHRASHDTVPPEPPEPPDVPESGITAAVTGHGPDVVLVHGALGDCRQWAGIAESLQSRFRVIAVSRRSHWPHVTGAPGVPYTYENHRDDLLEYLRLLAGPVHLVGHSWGAGVVLLAALARPWVARTLTLIEPAFNSLLPKEARGLESELEDRHAMLAAVQSLAAAGRAEDAARALIDWTQGGTGLFDQLPAAAQAGLLENAPTVAPSFAGAAPAVTVHDLREFPAPALVVHGEHTRPYYRVIAETVAAALPQATLRVIPGARHMSIVERPGEVAATLDAFISGAS